MSFEVVINGLGRMGRHSLHADWDCEEFEFVQLNDPAGDATTFAHLLNFDYANCVIDLLRLVGELEAA